MKIGENVTVANVVNETTQQMKKEEVNASTIISLEKPNGTELLEKSLEGLAQGWKDIKNSRNVSEPTLSEKQLEDKAKLEKQGLKVTVRPDGKFIVEAPKDKETWVSSRDIKNIAIFKGNLNIYNGEPQSDVEYPNLESVVGNLTISEFNDECRTTGPNWGYACDVKFTNLKQVTGNLDIQNSACQLYLDSLEEVGGSLNIDKFCGTTNEVYINNIKSIKGDFNIQAGAVISSPQIFAAVEGTMNEIPPESRWSNNFGTCLQIGKHPNTKYYEFTTESGVIKKYNI